MEFTLALEFTFSSQLFVFFVFVVTIPNKFPCRIVPHMLCKQPLYQAHTLRGIL